MNFDDGVLFGCNSVSEVEVNYKFNGNEHNADLMELQPATTSYYKSLSEKDKNDVKNLLDGWNMGFLFQTCLDECMDIEAFHYINSFHIDKLLKKYPLSVHIKFEHYVKQWQNSKWNNNSSESTLPSSSFTSPSSSLSAGSLEPIITFSLDEVLKRSTHGTMIINYYESNKNLNETCRNLLVDLIIASLLEEKRPMSTTLANHISEIIVGTFTTEIKEIYFERSGSRKCPKGKLYAKYFNKLRSLKSHGLMSSQVSKVQKNNEPLSRIPGILDVELTIEEDSEILIASLKHEELSWPDIEMIWTKTTGYRLNQLKTTNYSPSDIHKTWPQYMQPLGYKLIDIDFKRLYEKCADLLSTYEKSFVKLLLIIDERIKDPSCRKMLEDMKNTNNASENYKNAVVLYALHALFVPTTKKSFTDSNGKKCLQKFSIKDSQNTFMIVANTAVELEEILKTRKNTNIPIQPCLLVVGTIPNPLQIMVYFDESKYVFFSIIKALDMCFKIYHVFNIEYPIESFSVWLFIQHFFYKIKLSLDKPCPLIKQIISEFK